MTHVRMTDTPWRAPGDPTNDRTLEFIISTNARDSHHTVLNQNRWDLTRYQANGIVGYQHAVWGAPLCGDPNPDVVIGPGRAYIENQGSPDARLIGVWTAEPRDINELADKIFRKVMFGTLKATSVGFFEVGKGQWGTDEEAEGMLNETYYFEGQQLAEWSIVNMGSNPETVKRNLEGQTRAAIAYVKAQLPELSTRDVLRMTVKDVLDALDGNPLSAAFVDTTRAEARQPVPDFIEGVEAFTAQVDALTDPGARAARELARVTEERLRAASVLRSIRL